MLELILRVRQIINLKQFIIPERRVHQVPERQDEGDEGEGAFSPGQRLEMPVGVHATLSVGGVWAHLQSKTSSPSGMRVFLQNLHLDI